MDYKALLTKYMHHVIHCEGYAFIPAYIGESNWSHNELEELIRISNEYDT